MDVVPCKDLAEELDLPVHQRETFRQWEVSASLLVTCFVSYAN
jgi:hypothetical protein